MYVERGSPVCCCASRQIKASITEGVAQANPQAGSMECFDFGKNSGILFGTCITCATFLAVSSGGGAAHSGGGEWPFFLRESLRAITRK
jgi:hypothetical protein